jgi:hypothetical protein
VKLRVSKALAHLSRNGNRANCAGVSCACMCVVVLLHLTSKATSSVAFLIHFCFFILMHFASGLATGPTLLLSFFCRSNVFSALTSNKEGDLAFPDNFGQTESQITLNHDRTSESEATSFVFRRVLDVATVTQTLTSRVTRRCEMLV